MPSGHLVPTDHFFSWNAVDLSDHVESVRIEPTKSMHDDTVMGLTNKRNLAGLTDWRVTVRFKQDYAAGEVDATLWADFLAGTARTWVFRPDKSDGVGVTNPDYSATGLIESYPIGGAVDSEVLAVEIVIVPGGTAPAIDRATV